MNSTSATVVQQLITQSRSILARDWQASLVLGLMGLLGLAENLLIIGVVLRGHLVTKAHHYFCVLNLAVADAFSGIIVTCLGMRRYIRYATNGDEVSIAWACMAEVAPTFIASWATLTSTLVIAIDRLFAVAKPVEYQVVSAKKMRVLNYVAWATTFVLTAILFFGVGDWLVPICGYAFVFQDWVIAFSSTIQGILETPIVLTYVCIMLFTYTRKRKVAAGEGILAETRKVMSQRVAKSATFILSVFVLFFVVPDCIMTTLSYIADGALVPYYGPWYLCLQYVPCCLNLPVYMWKNEQFREQARVLCCAKKATRVQPMSLHETKHNAHAATDGAAQNTV